MSLYYLAADIVLQNPLPVTQNNAFTNALYIVYGVLGGISLIVLVWAGLKYVLSGGDPAKTAEARNQIIYAAIGVAVALSAGAITQVVIGRL